MPVKWTSSPTAGGKSQSETEQAPNLKWETRLTRKNPFPMRYTRKGLYRNRESLDRLHGSYSTTKKEQIP